MPSIDHEAVIQLFRNDPKLVVEVLWSAFDLRLSLEGGEPIESTLIQSTPVEYRADLVLSFGNERVIVEVQLDRDARKPWTWPNYVTSLRARDECEVYLLVVTNSPSVSRWASQEIPLGNPGSSFRPLVLGPGTAPRITTQEVARQNPELAVLSAILEVGGGTAALETFAAAFVGAMALEDEQVTLFTDWLAHAAGPLWKQVLEAVMATSQRWEPKSEFARVHWSRGLEEGREEGRVSAMAEAVVKLLEARELYPSEQDKALIFSTAELPLLEHWFNLALTTSSVDELLRSRPSAP